MQYFLDSVFLRLTLSDPKIKERSNTEAGQILSNILNNSTTLEQIYENLMVAHRNQLEDEHLVAGTAEQYHFDTIAEYIHNIMNGKYEFLTALTRTSGLRPYVIRLARLQARQRNELKEFDARMKNPGNYGDFSTPDPEEG